MNDNHVLITGCTRGIGLEIAQKMLSENYRVTGSGNRTGFPEELSASRGFKGIKADVGNTAELRAILKPVFETDLPGVLVNNAGIFVPTDFSSADDDWLEVWDRTLQVNLRASALLCKWFVNAHIQNRSEGIIINISSRAAYRGDNQEYGAYAASKAGIIAFTKSLARDFGKDGIVAYNIAPGFVKTDMARPAIEQYGEEYLAQESAFDRLTTPGEIAGLVSFLAKGKVKQMTGSTFHINGGSYMI